MMEHEVSIMVEALTVMIVVMIVQLKLMVNPLNGIDFKHLLETRCLINHQTTLVVIRAVQVILDIFQEATLQKLAKWYPEQFVSMDLEQNLIFQNSHLAEM